MLMRKKNLNRIKKNAGYTLTEMLCVVILIGLVSVGMVTGINTGSRQFKKSVRISEATTLYTTLQTILSNELRFTNLNTLVVDSNGNVQTFYSMTYAIQDNPTGLYVLDSSKEKDDVPLTDNTFGQLAIGDGTTFNRLLGKSSYTHNLGAKGSIQYHEAGHYFTVTLDIGIVGTNESIIQKSFDVRNLETVSSGSES